MATLAAPANSCVAVGATVEIRREDGTTETWTVGYEGASDLARGILASDAPLARALIGAGVGDSRTFFVGCRASTVSILRVIGGDRVDV